MSFMSAKYEITRPQLLAIIFFCLILISLNLFLLKQNRGLKQLARSNSESSITVGTKLLPLSGVDNSGEKVEVNSNIKQKTLLLVFSAACHFCAKNSPNWKEILTKVSSEKIKVVGVAFGENGEAFLKKYELENKFSTINLLPGKVAETPPFDITPQTILLDSDGKVEKVWSGVLDKKSFNEVLDSVGVFKPAV